MIKTIAITIIMTFVTTPGVAESYAAGVGVNAVQALPLQIQKIREALLSTGIDFNFFELPEERGLIYLDKGEIAIELYRFPIIHKKYPHLIRLEPPVDIQKFWLISGKEERCNLDLDSRLNESLIGLVGVRYFDLFAPQFNSYQEVSSIDQIALMLANDRASFSIWNRQGFDTMVSKTRTTLYFCDKHPINELPAYSWLHPDFKFLQPQIEAAYRKLLPE